MQQKDAQHTSSSSEASLGSRASAKQTIGNGSSTIAALTNVLSWTLVIAFMTVRVPCIVDGYCSSPVFCTALASLLVYLYKCLPTRFRVPYAAILVASLKFLLDTRGLSYIMENYAVKHIKGELVVITGASNGIGLALAKQLYIQGAEVIMACRSMQKCELAKDVFMNSERSANGGKATCLALDLADLDSVRSFAAELKQRILLVGTENERGIDYLVNNAGIVTEPGLRTKQGFEMLFGVMHLGHFLLTNLLLDNVQFINPKSDSFETKSQPPARIVNHASSAFVSGHFHKSLFTNLDGEGDLRGEITDGCTFDVSGYVATLHHCLITRPFWNEHGCDVQLEVPFCPVAGAYSRAKLAQVAFTKELQRRVDLVAKADSENAAKQGGSLQTRRVITSSLHPGEVQSGMVNVVDSIVRPTIGGVAIILQCLFGDYPPGSFMDGMAQPHTLDKSLNWDVGTSSWTNLKAWSFFAKQPKEQTVLSLPGYSYNRELRQHGLSAEEFQEKLWSVSEKAVGMIIAD